MKRTLLALLVLTLSRLHAQDLPMPSLFRYQNVFYNPAYTGDEKQPILNFAYHKDCYKLPDSPDIGYGSFDTPEGEGDNGIGVTAIYKRQRELTIVQAAVAYSFNFRISEFSNFRIGPRLVGSFYEIDYNKKIFAPGQQRQVGTDNVVTADIDLGTWLNYRDFFIGASALSLLQTNAVFTDSTTYLHKRQLYATTGYKFDKLKNISITPALLVRQPDPAGDLFFEANTTLELWETLILGATYRGFQPVPNKLAGYAGLSFEHVQLLFTADKPTATQQANCGLNYEGQIRFRF